MKAAISSLNPFAESYIPLSLRDPRSDKTGPAISNHNGTKNYLATDDLKLKGQEADDDFKGLPSQISNQIMSDMKSGDENFEMELAYLQMSFPGMSDQSVMDVYTFNSGDLEASMDMLSQLESVGTPPDALPDALDIGDIPETTTSGECSSEMAKNGVGESNSSSGSSKLAVES